MDHGTYEVANIDCILLELPIELGQLEREEFGEEDQMKVVLSAQCLLDNLLYGLASWLMNLNTILDLLD